VNDVKLIKTATLLDKMAVLMAPLPGVLVTGGRFVH
jgi:hypothetical protein